MYPATQTYWLERTDRVKYSLRRYTHWETERAEHPFHSAATPIGELPATWSAEGYLELIPDELRVAEDDPRWPTVCDCGYVFTADDEWQHFQDLLYRRPDTGEEMALRDAPPGASWDAWWLHAFGRGADGIALMVKCPNGRHWAVDSEASNCTRKGEPHQCWVRHGDPRECRVTVDKNSPNTCAAGAGSIQAGDYHGFLQNGVLTAG